MKCIMNEIDFDGKLVIGHNVPNRLLCPKNQAQMLEGELTVFDTIDRVAVGIFVIKFAIYSVLSCLEVKPLIRK